jgi:hypothetical protein
MEARNNLMSRAHGLDKKRRQEKTKVATRASIDQSQKMRAEHCGCPVLLASQINNKTRRSHHAAPVERRKKERRDAAAAATTTTASRTCLLASCFLRPIGDTVRVTRWNPLYKQNIRRAGFGGIEARRRRGDARTKNR